MMNKAAMKVHIDIVKFLHYARDDRRRGCTKCALNQAIEFGHLEVVKFLHSNRMEGFGLHSLNTACFMGNLEIVKLLLLTVIDEVDINVLIHVAAINKQHEIIQYLTDN